MLSTPVSTMPSAPTSRQMDNLKSVKIIKPIESAKNSNAWATFCGRCSSWGISVATMKSRSFDTVERSRQVLWLTRQSPTSITISRTSSVKISPRRFTASTLMPYRLRS